MKIIKKSVVILGIFLFFVAALCCRHEEEVQKIDLDKRISNISQLKRTIEKDKALTFCFDLRLTPQEDIRIYSSFMDYLKKETGFDFALLFSKNYRETIENIGTGKAQFAIIGGLSLLKAERDYGVKMLVKSLDKAGKGSYRTAIITKKGSPLNKLSQLKGCSFAFGSKYSTRGHIIPRYMLEKKGVLITDLEKYFFTGSHRNCVNTVLTGDACAGGIWDSLAFNLEQKGYIKILAFSDYYPSGGIAVNKDVPLEIAGKVKTAMLLFDPLGKNKEGLIDWSKTEMSGGFTEVVPQDYDFLKKMAIKYKLWEDQ